MLRKFIIALLLIAVLLIGSYYYFTLKKPVITADIRRDVPGSFIPLSKGVVHYELAGPADAQVV
jgi:hypothetical protein